MSDPPKPNRAIELADGVWADPGDVRFSFVRSGGPGGQAVNKLSTKATLRVHVDAIVGLSSAARQRLRRLAGRRLTADDELVLRSSAQRSQLDNKRACLERLGDLVTEAKKVPKKRKKTRPSKAARERRLAEKRRLAKKKETRRRPKDE